jgi:hypothetical protein
MSSLFTSRDGTARACSTDSVERQEACPPRDETFEFPYVGRLIWKRVLAELTECARQERLVVTYDADEGLFSVALTVTVHGDSRALARFAAFTASLLMRYGVSSATG